MKNLTIKFWGLMMATLIVLSGCSSMNNTTKGGLIGGSGAAAVGALVGNLVSGKGDKTKGTLIGAGIGAAVGATAGALIGNKMDKAAAAAQEIENATVETVTDGNGLKAVKVTFESGILFASNQSTLNSGAQKSLTEFAQLLKNYNDADVAIIGHTDSTGSDAINQPLSEKRAASVADFLKSKGVSASQIAKIEGMGSTSPVADNSTVEGRTQNRRVEVYLYASEEMIEKANAGTL